MDPVNILQMGNNQTNKTVNAYSLALSVTIFEFDILK